MDQECYRWNYFIAKGIELRDMKKIILFGAGVYAKKYKALLEYLHMDFDYFSDNDSSKWGALLYGKPIIAPNELVNFSECQIIISSTHEIVIRKQLSEMGLADCIVGLDDLYSMCEQQMERVTDNNVSVCQEDTIIVDMYEGIGWGGTELWAANLAYGLKQAGKGAILVGGTEQPALEERYECLTKRISEHDTIMHMVDLFEKNLPCVFVNNFAGCAFMAAIIVKKKYPDLVKIISVIHNDNKSLFDAHTMMAGYIDKIFCVSNQIRIHMQELYDFDQDRYFFKEQPIENDLRWTREWNVAQPIQIGYAARLVKQQKRADLLVDLIDCLEHKKVEYVFNIAGEGECAEIISKYIATNQLEEKVKLFGRLPKEEMNSFWKKQDVFVNISEYEGTSLSMLEAMSYGCAPVVTDVSGAREFIEDGENGYICEVGDLSRVSDCIIELAQNRQKLETYGMKSRKIIAERCNPSRYIDFWIEEMI